MYLVFFRSVISYELLFVYCNTLWLCVNYSCSMETLSGYEFDLATSVASTDLVSAISYGYTATTPLPFSCMALHKLTDSSSVLLNISINIF